MITAIEAMVSHANFTTTMVVPEEQLVLTLMPPTTKVNVMNCESELFPSRCMALHIILGVGTYVFIS